MHNGICTCAMHCPQSPHHEYACCRSQTCDCWCHQIVNREHKVLVRQATDEQRQGAMLAYAKHRRACADVGIEPENFGKFLAEWLEVEAQPKEDAGPGADDDVYLRRDYDLMFRGQKGWA